MRIITLIIALASAAYAQPDSATFWIFLTGGQSNAAGFATATPTDSAYSNNRIWVRNDAGTWIKAYPALGSYGPNTGDTKQGPSFSFLLRMTEKYRGLNIGIAPFTLGSSMISDWMPGNTGDGSPVPVGASLYDSLSIIGQAVAADGIVQGLLWQHGEADAWYKTGQGRAHNTYDDSIRIVIDSLWADFGYELPIFLCGPPLAVNRDSFPYADTIIQQMQAIADSEVAITYIDSSTEGLILQSDSIHLTLAGQYSLGYRFAGSVIDYYGLEPDEKFFFGYSGTLPHAESTVVYYDFNRSATFTDLAGNVTGTRVNSVTIASKFGFALCDSFNGTSAYDSVLDNNVLSFGNGTTDKPFSISAWIYPKGVNLFNLFNKYRTGKGVEYRFKTANDAKFYLLMNDNSSAGLIFANTNTTITANKWQHVCVTYDGSGSQNGIEIYFDGVTQPLTRSSTGSYTAMENTGCAGYIGTQDKSQFANGYIDCLTIDKQELTPSQVYDRYFQGRGIRHEGGL